jgi:hypothetical protein
VLHSADGMVIRARSMRWEVHVVSMGEKKSACVGTIITCTGFY